MPRFIIALTGASFPRSKSCSTRIDEPQDKMMRTPTLIGASETDLADHGQLIVDRWLRHWRQALLEESSLRMRAIGSISTTNSGVWICAFAWRCRNKATKSLPARSINFED